MQVVLMEVFSLRFNLIMIIFGFIRLTVVRQSLGHTAYLKKNLHLKIIFLCLDDLSRLILAG